MKFISDLRLLAKTTKAYYLGVKNGGIRPWGGENPPKLYIFKKYTSFYVNIHIIFISISLKKGE